MIRFIILGLVLLFTLSGFSQAWMTMPDQPEELGNIRWLRNYDEAIIRANIENKPIFILFQEVPGCATCRNYGNDLLTHPHIVEAVESHFIPLAIFNNKGGHDAAILKKYNEPSWNNPVARIIDPSKERDIVKRLNGRYDMTSLVDFISKGMLASGQLIPSYFDLLSQEVSTTDIRETHLAMYCFWSGEKAMANIDGVVATKAGFMNGHEVVTVKYDADQVSEEQLFAMAKKSQCADAVFTNDKREIKAAKKKNIPTQKEGKFKPDSQPKYYIYNTNLKYLPMTGLQALKVNEALSRNQSVTEYLSPRQIEMYELLKHRKNKFFAIDEDFVSQWFKVVKG